MVFSQHYQTLPEPENRSYGEKPPNFVVPVCSWATWDRKLTNTRKIIQKWGLLCIEYPPKKNIALILFGKFNITGFNTAQAGIR
jgi:hypothetical protein